MVEPSTINPSTLPFVPLAERASLPAHAGLYFALGADGVVLYIGKTSTTLQQRWHKHHRLKQLSAYENVRIAYLYVDDPSLLDELERACKEHFQPLLNGQVIPGGAKTAAPGETWTAVRLPVHVMAEVEEIARREERSVSFIMRRLVMEALEARRERERRT